MKLQYTFIRQFLLRGLHPRTPAGGPLAPRPPSLGDPPRTPQRGYPPSALPRVEECTYFWGVNTSWGIDTAESKEPLHQEDNQAPQPTYPTTQVLESIFPSAVLGDTIAVRRPIGLSTEGFRKSRSVRTQVLSDALPLEGVPTGVTRVAN
jgi:hypothetical protein